MVEKKGSKVEIKKMVNPNDFEGFAKPIWERFQADGITPEDIEAAINWARGQQPPAQGRGLGEE